MFLIRNEHAAVLILALTQCLVFGSMDHEKNRKNYSTEMIGSYLTLPWIDGLGWLVHSSESSEGKDVRTVIRAIVAGETWATQILDTVWKDQPELENRVINHSEIHNKCAKAHANNAVDTDDGHCILSPVGTDPERTAFSVPMSDLLLSYNSQNDQVVDDVIQRTPVGYTDFTTLEISMIVLFSALVVVLLGCTVCDFVKKNAPGEWSSTVNTLAKFSLYRNGLALLDAKVSDEVMPAIHGLRCLCCFSVMFGHRWLLVAVIVNEKYMLMDFIKAKSTLFGVYIKMVSFAVDIFCVIAGFLAAHMFFKLKKSGMKFNFLTMYLYRYSRLTPCVAFIVLFTAVFAHRFESGPMWEAVPIDIIDPCRENWWIDLLYVQNIVASDRMCLPHTWYLSLDMQLFWLSPLVLYPLYRSPKFGLRLLNLLLLASVVTPAIILAVNIKSYSFLWMRLDMNFTELVKNFRYYYTPTYNRAVPHLVGILLGYDLATKKRHLTKMNVVINWIATVLLLLFCTWFNDLAYDSGFVGDRDMEIAAAVLVRPCWSIATAWVIYACTQGYGGFVTKLLSLRIFLPLSRLSYCIYLVHVSIQVLTISAYYGSSAPSWASYILNGVFGDLVLSIPLAFALNSLIESPSIVLTRILMENRGRKSGAATPVKECKEKSELVATEKDSPNATHVDRYAYNKVLSR